MVNEVLFLVFKIINQALCTSTAYMYTYVQDLIPRTISQELYRASVNNLL